MPSYPIEESDYAAGSGALSGERVFKNTVPATTVREQTENGLWHSLRTIIRQFQISGDLTAANYATELAAGFINVSKAVRRAARRFLADNIANVTLTTSNTVMTVSPDVACYHLIDTTPTPVGVDATVHPAATSEANDKGRLILIVNMTDSFKYVGNSYYQKYVRLAPRESCWFYGFDETGSGTIIWQAIGRPFEDLGFQTFSALLRDSANTGNNVAMDILYRVNARVVTLYLPPATLTFGSGPGTLMDIVPNGGTVPAFLKPFPQVSGQSISPIIAMVVNGTAVAALTAELRSSLDTGRLMRISKPGGSWTNGDVVQIAAQCITYLGA